MQIAKIIHADHGIDHEVIQWLVGKIQPTGFFLRTLELPAGAPDALNALYGPASGDEPIRENDVFYKQRSKDRPTSRMIDLPKRPTRKVTILGDVEDGKVVVYSCYGGPAAPREVGDPTLLNDQEKTISVEFWMEHALAAE